VYADNGADVSAAVMSIGSGGVGAPSIDPDDPLELTVDAGAALQSNAATNMNYSEEVGYIHKLHMEYVISTGWRWGSCWILLRVRVCTGIRRCAFTTTSSLAMVLTDSITLL
jgi:hypothetical protein